MGKGTDITPHRAARQVWIWDQFFTLQQDDFVRNRDYYLPGRTCRAVRGRASKQTMTFVKSIAYIPPIH